MPNQRGNACACARTLMLPLVVLALSGAAHPTPPERVCAELARAIEREEGIPPGLVQAVTLAETGRWDPDQRRSYAWPWTVTSKRDTYYLPDKAGALAKVRELQAAGRRNIDVGCMQINLMWHGSSFSSLAEALEPERNISYGANFLKRLRVDTRSWSRATARYHSSHPGRGNAYRAKVYRLWDRVREVTQAATQDVSGEPAEPPRRASRAGLMRRVGAPVIGPSATAAPGAIPILRGW